MALYKLKDCAKYWEIKDENLVTNFRYLRERDGKSHKAICCRGEGKTQWEHIEKESVPKAEMWKGDKEQMILTEHQTMSSQLLRVSVRGSHSGQRN